MQDFLNRKSDSQEFCSEVFGLHRNLMTARDQFLVQLCTGEVKDFQQDPISKKPSSFLTFLLCYCDDFMENDEFCNAMQNGFLNFQKALNEE
jgi:hypothetical protein